MQFETHTILFLFRILNWKSLQSGLKREIRRNIKAYLCLCWPQFAKVAEKEWEKKGKFLSDGDVHKLWFFLTVTDS